MRYDVLALLGVAIFAGTYPATRLAMAGGVTPLMNASVRILGAGVLALVVLTVLRIPRPGWRELGRFALAGFGVGVAFPLALGYALQLVPASHAAVVTACLPLATTAYAGLRGHTLPGRRFWEAGAVASLLVLTFSWRHAQAGISEAVGLADLLLLVAMAGAAVGYVEGARLTTPQRPGWQVISWALVALLPVALPVALVCLGGLDHALPISAWAALGYGTVFSMYLGFFPWYAAMAAVGVARVSQWQYLQPFAAMAYAVLLLGEGIDAVDLLLAAGVVASIAWSRRTA